MISSMIFQHTLNSSVDDTEETCTVFPKNRLIQQLQLPTPEHQNGLKKTTKKIKMFHGGGGGWGESPTFTRTRDEAIDNLAWDQRFYLFTKIFLG